MVTIDPDVLLAASRDLVRHGLDIADECAIPPPDTGPTIGVTVTGVRQLLRRATATAEELHGLGDGLELFVSTAANVDGEVGAVFDLVNARWVS